MSARIVILCDQSGRYGTCAAQHHAGTADEDEARASAERAGWSGGGAGADLCPAHAPRRPRGGPPCGTNPNTRLTPGDAAAVAEFRDYLARRAAERTT
ncbi:hypothetical protein [Streptomyces sp. NPDC086838]|uniref:hypothetical protein n=1 Tax=Streptomyces sp. NPDC086838 TaxID=3365762 RepID=UPI00381085D4